MDEAEVRRRMYRAPTPRERERWHALWLLAQDWRSAAVADALERDAHTIGQWATAFAERGPAARSTRPLAWGDRANIIWLPSSSIARPNWVGVPVDPDPGVCLKTAWRSV